jgi:hypothetical protein
VRGQSVAPPKMNGCKDDAGAEQNDREDTESEEGEHSESVNWVECLSKGGLLGMNLEVLHIRNA